MFVLPVDMGGLIHSPISTIRRDHRKDLWRTPHENQQNHCETNHGRRETNDINNQQRILGDQDTGWRVRHHRVNSTARTKCR